MVSSRNIILANACMHAWKGPPSRGEDSISTCKSSLVRHSVLNPVKVSNKRILLFPPLVVYMHKIMSHSPKQVKLGTLDHQATWSIGIPIRRGCMCREEILVRGYKKWRACLCTLHKHCVCERTQARNQRVKSNFGFDRIVSADTLNGVGKLPCSTALLMSVKVRGRGHRRTLKVIPT